MKTLRRPTKDVVRGATPGEIRRAANITPASVANAKRVITKLGLDGVFLRVAKSKTGRRAAKITSAARSISPPRPIGR